MPGGKQAGKRFSAPAPLPCRGVPSPDSAYLYVNDLERGKFFHWGVQFLWLWPAGTFETRAKMPELRLLRLLSTCLILWTYDLHLNVSEWMCAQSCLTLCDPMACSPPGSSVHGICHTRILEQVAISYSRESSQPRDGTCVSCVFCIGGWFFFLTTVPFGKPGVPEEPDIYPLNISQGNSWKLWLVSFASNDLCNTGCTSSPCCQVWCYLGQYLIDNTPWGCRD